MITYGPTKTFKMIHLILYLHVHVDGTNVINGPNPLFLEYDAMD